MFSAKQPKPGWLAAARGLIPSRGSLAWRLTAWYVATSLIIVLGVSLTLYATMAAQLRSVDDQVLEKRMLAISDLLQQEEAGSFWIAHEVTEDIEGPRQIFLRVIDGAGVIAQETPMMSEIISPSLFPAARARSGALARASVRASDGRAFRVLSARVQTGSGEVIVQAAADTSLDEILLARFRHYLAIVVGAAFAACIVIGWAVVRAALQPLNRITAMAREIGPKTLDRRLSQQHLPDELGVLAQAFNAMLERLQKAYEGLQYYADNVAHEIRTPLNKILMGVEIALMAPRTRSEYEESLEQQAEACRELSHLAQRLLFLARVEHNQMSLDPEPVSLVGFLAEIQEYFEASAADAGIVLRLEGDPGLRVGLDRTLFQRAITNLVANAITHSFPGSHIDISAHQTAQGVLIQVRDFGEGVGEEHLAHIFDRFYRADYARGGNSGRIGLGLAITRGIVMLHGGEVSMESAPNHGATVSITLPHSAIAPAALTAASA